MSCSEMELRSRRTSYDSLVRDRKACQLCAGLINPSEVLKGALDSDQIGPWSRWQGSLFPEVVVVGQDFSDKSYFEQQLGRDNLLSHTNIQLKSRLNELGFALDCGDKGRQHGLFFTNAVLCLKTNETGMQGPVSKNHSAICSEKFLKPLLEILKPRIIIALGEVALNAIRQTQNLPKQKLRDAVSLKEGETLQSGARLFAVYHLSLRTQNVGHRTMSEQNMDWNRIRKFLKR